MTRIRVVIAPHDESGQSLGTACDLPLRCNA